MSTKTTLKRIALVAVSALGVGLLSVAPSQAALNTPGAAPFAPATTIVGAPVNTSGYNYTVQQLAGAANFVQFNGTTNVTATASDLFGVRVVITGGTLRSGKGATGTCNDGTNTLEVKSVSTTYASGVWGPNSAGSSTRLLTTDMSNTTCTGNYGAAYTTYTGGSVANFTIGTPTAGTITAQIYGDIVSGGAVTSTLLQTFTIVVLPVASGAFTSARVTKAVGANALAYYNPYEGFYAPRAAAAGSVGSLTVNQYAGSSLITDPSQLKAVTVTLTGVGSLDAGVVGASYLAFPVGVVTNSLAIPVYPDGRSGEGSVVISVNGVVNSTTKFWFYGQPASITAAAVLANGRAVSTGATTGSLTWIDYGTCTLGTEASCNTAVSGSIGTTAAPEEPGAKSKVAVAVLVKDANGIPVPTPVVGSSSNNAVVSNALSNWLLDSGTGDYSAGTYYQHITYATPPQGVSGSTANLTYSILNADGTLITSNPVAITLGGSPATVTMTSDKAAYTAGEAGVITITAKDAAGNASYDGAALFSKVEVNTALFTGSLPSTATTTTAGKATHKFFAPPVPGNWTITATLADGSTLALPVTVAADTSAIDAAADAAAEAIDAANAATDAANLAAEAADAATVAAEEARDAADAATAAIEELATQVATLMAALKAQITTLANTVAKIAKKVKA